MNSTLIDVQKNGAICTLTINRPEALNALNQGVLSALSDILDRLEHDSGVRVVVLTGQGKAFVAGADIAEMKSLTPAEAGDFATLGASVFRRLELMDQTVIAAVNGFALGGGCELAMAADIRLASQKAKFGQPEVGLGIIPGFTGTQRLPRLVGVARAKEMILSGQVISAEEAKEIGLVNRIYEPDRLMEEAMELAGKICANSPVAVKLAKRAINNGTGLHIEGGMALERELFSLCFAEEDQKEGMSAFLEKRRAQYKP